MVSTPVSQLLAFLVIALFSIEAACRVLAQRDHRQLHGTLVRPRSLAVDTTQAGSTKHSPAEEEAGVMLTC
jgi:hypothetical protein